MNRSIRVLAFLLAIVAAACGSSSDSSQLSIEAAIDDQPIADATPSNPLPFDPRKEGALTLTMTNSTNQPIEVQRVRIEGELLGLNFLTYDVRVRLDVAPGTTREVVIPIDFFELEKQASGYLRAFVRVYGPDGERIASQPFAIDIRGNVTSMMALFSMGLLLITALTAWLNVRDVRRGELPTQRFARGIRFLVPGLGLGLLLSVAFSVLRVFPLPATGWVPLTLIPAIAGFVIGYAVIPDPETADVDRSSDLDTDDDLVPLDPDDLEDVRSDH